MDYAPFNELSEIRQTYHMNFAHIISLQEHNFGHLFLKLCCACDNVSRSKDTIRQGARSLLGGTHTPETGLSQNWESGGGGGGG